MNTKKRSNIVFAGMHENSIAWYERARGVLDEELSRLATLRYGRLVGEEASDARNVAERRAEAGSGFAMCICVFMAKLGCGQPKSERRALEWAERAAKIGYPPGYLLLSRFHDEGIVVERNVARSVELCRLACRGPAAFAEACTQLAVHYARLGEAKRARRYAFKGYLLGDPMAPLVVAGWHEDGTGGSIDYSAARCWYEVASSAGNYFASDRLAKAYETGDLENDVDEGKHRHFSDLFWNQVMPG